MKASNMSAKGNAVIKSPLQCDEHKDILFFCCLDCKKLLCCHCLADGYHKAHYWKRLEYVIQEKLSEIESEIQTTQMLLNKTKIDTTSYHQTAYRHGHRRALSLSKNISHSFILIASYPILDIY